MKRNGLLRVVLAGGAVALLAARPAAAQDAEAGLKLVKSVCGACHGVDGIAKMPEAANLAGQDSGYIQRQLEAFRGGQRVNETMSLVAKGLTDDQIQDVAAYYGGIKIRVVSKPAE